LVIQRDDGKSYTFGSLDKRDVQVMEVQPGRYWLMKVVFADPYGMPKKTVMVDRADQRPLDFAAGHAYYVGDFFAKGDFWTESESIWRGPVKYLEWAVSPGVGDHYPDTTGEMKRAFPNLAALPTVDLPLFLPREHKHDNGIGPSPGEPAMSPQRVALLAPFIKQSFKSPSQCESACPAGQCLPYRGESGAAIACVIRCNRDADCPSPLACNCPNSEKAAGPACTPIASTPKDALARICLAAPAPETPPQQPESRP
jgi:hypothetical protein